MKIVIVNQHTCNRGDEAAGRAVIESLTNTFPDATIDVLYRFLGEYPPIDKNTDKVHHYPEFKYKYNKHFLLPLYLEIGFNFILGFFRFKRGYIGNSGKLYKKIANADIVVNAPTGPNIGDIYHDKFYMLNLIFSIISGKKTFMYGSSVGPFNTPWVKKWAKFIFEGMKVVCVREDISLKYLKNLNLKNKYITSSIDAAIQRNINTKDSNKYYENANLQLNKINVGITPLAYLWYPTSIRSEEVQKKIEKNLVKVINEITKNNDTNVFFFPQLYSITKNDKIGRNDIPIINSIINQVEKPDFCKVVPNEYDSDVQQAMISKLDYFIGMRYHSIIFSIKMGIPVIGICYEHKASGFLEKINLSGLIVKIQDFVNNDSIVTDKIEYIKQNKKAIQETIKQNLPKIKRLSGKGSRLIRYFLFKEHKS